MKVEIIKNTAANLFGMFGGVVVQLVSVGVLSRAWGAEHFGLWLLLTSIPTFLNLTDVGLTSAVTMRLTRYFSQNRHRRYRELASTTLVTLLGICTAILVIGHIVAATLSSVTADFPFKLWSVIVIYSALSIISRYPLAIQKSTGNYSFGTVANDLLTLLETSCVIIVALFGYGIETGLYALLLGRAIHLVVSFFLLKRLDFDKVATTSAARVIWIRLMLKPSLAAFTIPATAALSLQGTTALAATVVSMTAAASLGPLRTASRLSMQAANTITRAVMPIIARHNLTTQQSARNSAEHTALIASNGTLLPALLIFVAIGPSAINLWTGGVINSSRIEVLLMALVTLLASNTMALTNFMLASERHQFFAIIGVPISILGVVIVALFASVGRDLTALLVGMIVAETIMAIGAAYCYLRRS